MANYTLDNNNCKQLKNNKWCWSNFCRLDWRKIDTEYSNQNFSELNSVLYEGEFRYERESMKIRKISTEHIGTNEILHIVINFRKLNMLVPRYSKIVLWTTITVLEKIHKERIEYDSIISLNSSYYFSSALKLVQFNPHMRIYIFVVKKPQKQIHANFASFSASSFKTH